MGLELILCPCDLTSKVDLRVSGKDPKLKTGTEGNFLSRGTRICGWCGVSGLVFSHAAWQFHEVSMCICYCTGLLFQRQALYQKEKQVIIPEFLSTL